MNKAPAGYLVYCNASATNLEVLRNTCMTSFLDNVGQAQFKKLYYWIHEDLLWTAWNMLKQSWTAKMYQYQCFCSQNLLQQQIRSFSMKRAPPRIQVPLNFFNEIKWGSSVGTADWSVMDKSHVHAGSEGWTPSLTKDQLIYAVVKDTDYICALH